MKGTIAVTAPDDVKKIKQWHLKTIPFNNCISKSNVEQADNVKEKDVVIWMYNLFQYSEN